jgi:type I restriction-modification system DNA methylase subunit
MSILSQSVNEEQRRLAADRPADAASAFLKHALMPKACTEEGFQSQAWNLARMNRANLGPRNADSFRQNLHPDLKADFILATATRVSANTTLAKPNRRSVGETELHPPFNMSDWGGEDLLHYVLWRFGMPQVNNANNGWIQHVINHLSCVGVAGFVMSKPTRIAHSCPMKITEVGRKYSAEQGITEELELANGIEEKFREFTEKRICVKT